MSMFRPQEQQIEILDLLVKGYPNKQIARLLQRTLGRRATNPDEESPNCALSPKCQKIGANSSRPRSRPPREELDQRQPRSEGMHPALN